MLVIFTFNLVGTALTAAVSPTGDNPNLQEIRSIPSTRGLVRSKESASTDCLNLLNKQVDPGCWLMFGFESPRKQIV